MSGTVGPELQIWRQTAASSDTYTKIASTEVIANETEPDSNVHEYYLDTPIEFMEGDVFGMFLPNNNKDSITLYSQSLNGPNNYRVISNVDTPSTDLKLSELSLTIRNNYPLAIVSLEMSKGMVKITGTNIIVAVINTILQF